MSPDERIVVIGSGVIGLSVAVVLAEAGYGVEVVSRRQTPRTTASDVAAAYWHPPEVDQAGRQWAESTLHHFRQLISNPHAGICQVQAKELLQTKQPGYPGQGPWWWTTLPEVASQVLGDQDVPAPFEAGMGFRVPVIRMPDYMRYLTERFLANPRAGISNVEVSTIEQLVSAQTRLIVNCSGLGARELVPDPNVYACRGQVVVVEPIDLDQLIYATSGRAFEDKPIYIVPRCGRDIVLGGTREDDVEDLTPDESVTHEIIARCTRLCPALQNARVLEPKVGLRPCRVGGLRLEVDHRWATPVIHNYGHGPTGVTFSWGCAQEVLALVNQSLSSS